MKNLHIYPSYIEYESRIEKITKSLLEQNVFNSIYILGLWKKELLAQEVLPSNVKINRARNYLFFLPYTLRKISDLIVLFLFTLKNFRSVDVINCHSLNCLFIGVFMKITFGTKVVYDTHELETERDGLKGIRQRIAKRVESICMRYIDGIVFVSDSIARWYENEYPNITNNISVIYNYPNRVNLHRNTHNNYFNQKFEIADGSLIFVYAGLLSHERGIQTLLETFEKSDHHLIFIGHGPMEFDVSVKAKTCCNIHYHNSVRRDMLISIISTADLGIYTPFNLVALNNKLAMPNKIFEYIQSNLPIITSKEFIDVSKLVESYELGWCVESQNQLAHLLNQIDMDLLLQTKRNVKNHSVLFTWENQEKLIQDFYKKII